MPTLVKPLMRWLDGDELSWAPVSYSAEDWMKIADGPRGGNRWQHKTSGKISYKEPGAAKEPGDAREEKKADPPKADDKTADDEQQGKASDGDKTADSEDEGTPREEADKAAKEALDDYKYARQSAIPNMGEDVRHSARHNRNAWRGLAQAEQDGTAGALVTRDQLFKNEPMNLMARITPLNALPYLAAHLCMQKFPASPEAKGARYPSDSTAETRRKTFYEAYKRISNFAERAADEETDPRKVIGRINEFVRGEIGRIRGQTGTGYMSQYTAPNRFDPVANLLVVMAKRTETGRWRPKKLDVAAQLADFVGRTQKKYGEPSKTMLDKISEHVKDVMEGESFNKTFGSETAARKTINPADMYVKKATRKGGPVIDADTVKSGSVFMADKLKMRAVQWGNSVSDEEREHHLKYSAEAFADLTSILGLPESAASLDGKLALAIGARGKGTALAHYEPDLKVINLTRKNGVGSLAHEWGHFFDHQLAGGEAKYMSERHAPEHPMHNSFFEVRKAFRDSGFSDRLNKQVSEYRRRGFLSEAKAGYWKSGREVFARCFERYVQHKLKAAGRENTYLSGWEAPDVPGEGLWPIDEEVSKMAPAFDAIFDAYKKMV